MRLPRVMLPHQVDLRALAATTARQGATYADPIRRRGSVEERSALKIDQRTSSDTAGTEIVMSTVVYLQVEDYLEPGGLIDYRGKTLTVANARRYEAPLLPSSAELWCV